MTDDSQFGDPRIPPDPATGMSVRARRLIGGLAALVVLLAGTLVVVLTRDDQSGGDAIGSNGSDASAADVSFAELPPLEDIPTFPCQTITAGPPGTQLVAAGFAATDDHVVFLAETAAAPVYSSDYDDQGGLRAGDWSVFIDFSLWTQNSPDNWQETYLFLLPPLLSPGGLVGGGFIDPSYVEWGRDGVYSWMVVDRDGLSVVDELEQMGVVASGVSQVYVDNGVVGSPDFFVGQRAEEEQWCPNAEQVQVVELPPR